MKLRLICIKMTTLRRCFHCVALKNFFFLFLILFIFFPHSFLYCSVLFCSRGFPIFSLSLFIRRLRSSSSSSSSFASPFRFLSISVKDFLGNRRRRRFPSPSPLLLLLLLHRRPLQIIIIVTIMTSAAKQHPFVTMAIYRRVT